MSTARRPNAVPRSDRTGFVMKNGRYVARLKVPMDLRGALGVTYLTRALQTTSRREAKRQAQAWTTRLDQGLAALREGLADPDEPREWLRGFAERAFDDLDEQCTVATPSDHAVAVDEPITMDLEVGSVLDGVVAALRAIGAGVVTPSRQMRDRGPNSLMYADGLDVGELARAVAAQLTGGRDAAHPEVPTFADALARYVEFKSVSREWPKGADDQKVTMLQRMAEYLVDETGDPTPKLDQMTGIRAYKYVNEVLTGRGGEGQASHATRSARLGILKFFMDWAVRERMIDRHSVQLLKGEKVQKAQDERGMVPVDAFPKLFTAELVEACHPGPRAPKEHRHGLYERLWVPMLVATLGCRVHEAAQSHADDVVEVDGIPCIRIDADERRGQHVKGAASLRTVPIPSVVLDRGFLKYVEQIRSTLGEEAPLYPACAAAKGGHEVPVKSFWNGGPTSKRPKGGWLCQHGVYVRDQITLYSFKHTAQTMLHEAGVDEVVRSDIVGHARKGGEGNRRYVKGTSVVRMREAMESVDWQGAFDQLPAYERPASSSSK